MAEEGTGEGEGVQAPNKQKVGMCKHEKKEKEVAHEVRKVSTSGDNRCPTQLTEARQRQCSYSRNPAVLSLLPVSPDQ